MKHQLGEQTFCPAVDERPEKRRAILELRPPHCSSEAAHESSARSEFYGQGIQQSGSGNIRAQNIYIGATREEDANCLADLRSTDPRDDKLRIQRTKGNLVPDLHQWILNHDDFRQWRNDDESRLLWIKGDPGKGKTMLLCGIIDELKKKSEYTCIMSYFFCQATDTRLNNATAVLRGLIYLLLIEQPHLISHVRKKHAHAGKQLFEDVNSWDALSKLLLTILGDQSLKNIFLIIDGLDECEGDLNPLLQFIVHLSTSFQVKLIVSSRNCLKIDEVLSTAKQKVLLSLELNESSISAAVGKYIEYKVHELARIKKYDQATRDTVQQHLTSNAKDTFLWVAFVCQELADPKVRRWHTRAKLNMSPPGLNSLYERMMNQILSSYDVDLCKQVLALVLVACRPIALRELPSLVDLPDDSPDDPDSLIEIVGLCGSLLTIREGTIHFVHQSAKDFLLENTSSDKIFPSGMKKAPYTTFSRSLQAMSKTLRRDIYNLKPPGFPIDQVQKPERDPCIYWVDHLHGYQPSQVRAFRESDIIDWFLNGKCLYWLEALSLLGSV